MSIIANTHILYAIKRACHFIKRSIWFNRYDAYNCKFFSLMIKLSLFTIICNFQKSIFLWMVLRFYFPLALRTTIVAQIKIWWKTPKNHNFLGLGGWKNHKGKPIFFECLWVVFLDTDCKIKDPKTALKPFLKTAFKLF